MRRTGYLAAVVGLAVAGIAAAAPGGPFRSDRRPPPGAALRSIVDELRTGLLVVRLQDGAGRPLAVLRYRDDASTEIEAGEVVGVVDRGVLRLPVGDVADVGEASRAVLLDGLARRRAAWRGRDLLLVGDPPGRARRGHVELRLPGGSLQLDRG